MSYKDISLELERDNGETLQCARCMEVVKNTSKKDFDLWDMSEFEDTGTPWNEKTRNEKILSVTFTILKIIALLSLIYLFVCSIILLGDSFRLFGGKAVGTVLHRSAFFKNPIGCLVLGLLATAILQSSSTSTSIAVSMVASELLSLQSAIYIIMGTNIGTSLTNTIVAMGQVVDREQFRRAFAGASLHDMFNLLAVASLLPIEWISSSFGKWKNCGMLCQLTGAMVKNLKYSGKSEKQVFLKTLTEPFTNLIVQLDKNAFKKIAKGTINASEVTVLKKDCQKDGGKCYYLFEAAAKGNWTDVQVGVLLFFMSLVMLCTCLAFIVKVLHSLLRGRIAGVIKRVVNYKLPGRLSFLTGYVSILLGAAITLVLQSSSIFTSALTPLVGIGVLHLRRMYPLTLGANIGTTFTAIMAAFTSSRDKLQIALQVALCHLHFNILGILIWYPIPAARRVPISLAMKLGNTTARYRWFAIVYLVLMFGVVPSTLLGLSFAGWPILLGATCPILVLIISVVIINVLQRKCPSALPAKMQNWDFVPTPLRSLEPYDHLFTKMMCCQCNPKEVDLPNDGVQKRYESVDATEETASEERLPKDSSTDGNV